MEMFSWMSSLVSHTRVKRSVSTALSRRHTSSKSLGAAIHPATAIVSASLGSARGLATTGIGSRDGSSWVAYAHQQLEVNGSILTICMSWH